MFISTARPLSNLLVRSSLSRGILFTRHNSYSLKADGGVDHTSSYPTHNGSLPPDVAEADRECGSFIQLTM